MLIIVSAINSSNNGNSAMPYKVPKLKILPMSCDISKNDDKNDIKIDEKNMIMITVSLITIIKIDLQRIAKLPTKTMIQEIITSTMIQ